MDRTNRRRAGALAALIALIALAVAIPVAQAATGTARALTPSYSSSTLRLSGAGGYHASGRSAGIFVTVCLQKRSGGSFFDVRCKTRQASGHVVRARVSVPGCVRGAWKTTASGYAVNRLGTAKLAASEESSIFTCS